jgi:hypothetical protein
MEHPSEEIVSVVKLLTAARSPDIQKAAVERYFTSNAGFQHPLCAVESAPNSRQGILGIYQYVLLLTRYWRL